MMIDSYRQKGAELIHASIWCQRLKEALICTLMGLLAFVVNATSQEQHLKSDCCFISLMSLNEAKMLPAASFSPVSHYLIQHIVQLFKI